MDEGAQAERTFLAWQRTGLGTMVVGALMTHGRSLPPWLGLLLMAIAGCTVLVLGPRRYTRVLHAVRDGRTPLSHRMVPGATVVVVAVVIAVGAGLMLA